MRYYLLSINIWSNKQWNLIKNSLDTKVIQNSKSFNRFIQIKNFKFKQNYNLCQIKILR